MSRNKPKPQPPDFLTSKKSWNNNHHVSLFDEMIDSPAYISLSNGAKFIYTLIIKEYKGIFTGNKVKCPYSEMKKHNVRSQSISGWLKELEALGFIRIESHGGMYKIPNEYRLINDWMKFKSIEEAKAAKKKIPDDSG